MGVCNSVNLCTCFASWYINLIMRILFKDFLYFWHRFLFMNKDISAQNYFVFSRKVALWRHKAYVMLIIATRLVLYHLNIHLWRLVFNNAIQSCIIAFINTIIIITSFITNKLNWILIINQFFLQQNQLLGFKIWFYWDFLFLIENVYVGSILITALITVGFILQKLY